MKRRINEGNRDDTSLDKIGNKVLNLWLQFAAWTAKIVCVESYLGLSSTGGEQKHLLRRVRAGNDAKEKEKKNRGNNFFCASFLGAVDHDDKCIQKCLFCKENSVIAPPICYL